MKTKKILLILMAIILTISLNAQTTGTFKDTRDGHTYKWVKIGTQIWMAENLNYKYIGSICPNNSESNCNKYGRLYNWEISKKVCPSGWHLPTEMEWQQLELYLGATKEEVIRYRDSQPYELTDKLSEYGFVTNYPGNSQTYVIAVDLGETLYLWSSTSYNQKAALGRAFQKSYRGVLRLDIDKVLDCSVRCVKNE